MVELCQNYEVILDWLHPDNCEAIQLRFGQRKTTHFLLHLIDQNVRCFNKFVTNVQYLLESIIHLTAYNGLNIAWIMVVHSFCGRPNWFEWMCPKSLDSLRLSKYMHQLVLIEIHSFAYTKTTNTKHLVWTEADAHTHHSPHGVCSTEMGNHALNKSWELDRRWKWKLNGFWHPICPFPCEGEQKSQSVIVFFHSSHSTHEESTQRSESRIQKYAEMQFDFNSSFPYFDVITFTFTAEAWKHQMEIWDVKNIFKLLQRWKRNDTKEASLHFNYVADAVETLESNHPLLRRGYDFHERVYLISAYT